MRALGSYKGGSMLFLGLGTGLGSAMIVNGLLEPMELGHLPYRKVTLSIKTTKLRAPAFRIQAGYTEAAAPSASPATTPSLPLRLPGPPLR